MLTLRRSCGLPVWPSVANPIFVLATLGWVLGLSVVRFWEDWGAPAGFLWLALQTQEMLESYQTRACLARIGTAAALAICFYVSVSRDYMGRWTNNLTDEYLSAENPELADWLPEKGGTLYSADMRIFYQTFYKNPKAEWRYILGFEPTFMPLEDLKIYRSLQWNYGEAKAYLPWVKKMKLADRLAIRGNASSKPSINELEWHYAVTGLWIGRVPAAAKSLP
jgi:hypothetical protein